MRTHGARQQREAVKRAPIKQLRPVYEVYRPEISLFELSCKRKTHSCAESMLFDMHLLPFIGQALDTLGSTKWRVNKRVLGVIDRIWASGGRLGDLVDRNDVGSTILCAFFKDLKLFFFHF